MSLYLWINILSIAAPLLLSFDKRIRFYTHWKTLIPSILIIGSIFLAWDIYFTEIEVLDFNNAYLIGLTFFNLPIEEFIFFFTVPYLCVFIYEAVKVNFSNFRPVRFSYYFSLLFTITSITLAIIYFDNWYTFSVLIAAGIVNWIVYFGFTPRWYPQFIFAFLIALSPLLIINSALTGLFTENSVIWYNPEEIMGIHILTVPLESFFYNFLLFFSVVIIHEYLLKLWEQKVKST